MGDITSESGGMTFQEAREARGWTQYRASRVAGLNVSTVAHIEKYPDRAWLARAAAVLWLIKAYWPDVQLPDVIPDCPFNVEPRTKQMQRSLERARIEG